METGGEEVSGEQLAAQDKDSAPTSSLSLEAAEVKSLKRKLEAEEEEGDEDHSSKKPKVQLEEEGDQPEADSNKKREAGDQGKVSPGDDGKDEAGDDGNDSAGDDGKDSAGYDGKDSAGDDGKDSAGDDAKDKAGHDGKDEAGDDAKDKAGGKKEGGDQGKQEVSDQGKDWAGDQGKDWAEDQGKDWAEDQGKDTAQREEEPPEGAAKEQPPQVGSEDKEEGGGDGDHPKDTVKMEVVEEPQEQAIAAQVKEEVLDVKALVKEEPSPPEQEVDKDETNADLSVPKSETDEKAESSQRRYPMRHRGGDDKDGKTGEDKAASKSTADESSDKSDSVKSESVKSDSGSDKENLNGDTPMDLSNAGTPDVIMLSDEDDAEGKRKGMNDQGHEMKKTIRYLQSQLRNEEAKLVLLKKLRQSQLTPQLQDHPSTNTSSSSTLNKQAVPRQQAGPPPLVRGSQQSRSGSGFHMQQQQGQGRPLSQSGVRSMQGPPPLVGVQRPGATNTNGHATPGIRGSQHISQHSTSSSSSSSSHRQVQQQQHQQQQQQQQAATPPQPPVDTQTPAQRQAAAKLALRKQLEKTLLQIPPPKPPAPEMNFIPSLACPDFVLLLGLEEVVNHIIDLQLIARGHKSPDEKFICNPFTCVQCGTDYTPVWKREKPGSKNVICEHCVTWNQKRALKQEHTNRLKSAFVKALQQEQEIERMQVQTPSAPSTPTPSATPPSSSSSSTSTSAPPQALAAAAAASNVAAAAAMSMNPGSFRSSADVRHHSFLQQAHQAGLRAGQPLANLQGFGGRGSFPYSLPYVKQADLQRQYLLDMIPRASMPWKN